MSSLRFTIRPGPVLPEHRPLYKIMQLLLILTQASRGGKSSLPRLQLFNWALKSHLRTSILTRAAKEGRLHLTGWGFDPAVPIALRYAVAEGLVRDVPTGYEVTVEGEAFVDDCAKEGLFAQEREALAGIGKKVTEAMVTAVARTWEEH